MSKNAIIFWTLAALLILGCWQLLGSTPYGRFLISTPTTVGRYIGQNAVGLLEAGGTTAWEATMGLLAAVAFGVVFTVIAVVSPRVAMIFYPFLVASQIIPFVCLAPLVIMVFGLGMAGKIFLSGLMRRSTSAPMNPQL